MAGRKATPTSMQKEAARIHVESGGKSVSAAMREAGYTEKSAKNPQKLTESQSWKQLIDELLPETKLAQVHKRLLEAKVLDHMVFPLATPEAEIKKLLRSVGCTARRFQHGETAIHCWFWAPNTKAMKDAVEMGYKLRGRLKDTVGVSGELGVTFKVTRGEGSE